MKKKKKMASSTQHLPNEILGLILFQIDDQKTVISFSQTCKRFRHVALTPISSDCYESLVGSPDSLEARYPWHFLLASHKARHISCWIFSSSSSSSSSLPDPDRDEKHSSSSAAAAAAATAAAEFGAKEVINFAIHQRGLGLTYMDVILKRCFCKHIFEPLVAHILRQMQNEEEEGTPGIIFPWIYDCLDDSEAAIIAVLYLAIFVGLNHAPFTRKVQHALANPDLTTKTAKRRSLGTPSSSSSSSEIGLFGRDFLSHLVIMDHVESHGTSSSSSSPPSMPPPPPLEQIQRLTRFIILNTKGWQWPTWRRDTNGADIIPHVYGLDGLLAMFDRRPDQIPCRGIVDALSSRTVPSYPSTV